ncbi:MAG: homoserine kinase [Eubacteriales bacterium]
MFRIKVPATSANIGPGFDTLGLALNKYNYVNFKTGNEKFKISGNINKFLDDNNLVYKSYRKTEKHFKKNPKNIHIEIESYIPFSRGLGSSAACAVSGVIGAMLIHNIKLNKKNILKIASEIEGHPDNAASCIYGGLTASLKSKEKIYTEKYKVSESINFYAFIPSFELLTKDSRSILPDQISHSNAVFNLSRIPFLIKGLIKGDMNLIKDAVEDKIHQPYREKLVGEVELIKNIINKSDSVYYLSGAGPTIMSISEKDDLEENYKKEVSKLENKWEILRLKVDNEGFKYRSI